MKWRRDKRRGTPDAAPVDGQLRIACRPGAVMAEMSAGGNTLSAILDPDKAEAFGRALLEAARVARGGEGGGH